MSSDQKRARWFGVLYLITFVTSIPALALYQPVLDDPVGYVAGRGHDTTVLLGAVLELILIAANIGTAIAIVPILRRRFEELSLAYVAARLVESAFILVGIVAVVGVVTLRTQHAGGAAGTVAFALAALKDWTFLLGPGWVVGLGNGLILGYLMLRSGLVPRRATWLGLVGGPLVMLSGTAIALGGDHPGGELASLQAVATIPEVIWELFLGVYCSVWGFRRDATILASAGDAAPPSASARVSRPGATALA